MSLYSERLAHLKKEIATIMSKKTKKLSTNQRIMYKFIHGVSKKAIFTINGQEIQHLLELRSQKDVFWDFRILVYNLYLAIPDEHKYLYSVNLED